MKRRYVYAWVLRTVDKRDALFRHKQWMFFRRRCSLKNPRYLTQFHCSVKFFLTQDDALDYYMMKAQKVPHIAQCVARRMKIHVDGWGRYDYWKNSAAFDRYIGRRR